MKRMTFIFILFVTCTGLAKTAAFNRESLFFAGKYKIYAQKADFSVEKHGNHVVGLKLRLWLYRAELYHLVKAGVTNILDTKRLIQYRPLKPIIVDLKAKPVAVKALDKAMAGKKDNSVISSSGPWRHLLNFRFIRSKQETRPGDIKVKPEE